MGYLICSKCKSYYKLQSGESPNDFMDKCDCGGKIRYIENLDIIDTNWKPVTLRKKPAKKEVLKNKMQSLFSFRRLNIKTRLQQFYYNNIGKYINTRQHKINRNPYGMDSGLINSIRNELNLYNIQWILVIPAIITITLIFAFTHGISILLTYVILILVGYLSENLVLGAKSAVITGAISYLVGSLLIGSYLYIILYLILGIINGIVCGFIGGYIKTRMNP